MAGRAGGVLENVTAQARRVRKTRQLLGLSERGVPKAPVGPPATVPADPRPPQVVPQPDIQQAAGGVAPSSRLEKAQQFLAGLQGGAAANQQPVATSPISPVETSAPGMLSARMASVGMQNAPVDMQFYNMSGRAGSPRELVVLGARMLLERQLGRAPTVQELRQFVSRPTEISPSFPTAFEANPEG